MHPSVYKFIEDNLIDLKGKYVFEVGSLNVNGTVRHMIEQRGPSAYWGIDVVDGDCVDEVGDITDEYYGGMVNSVDVLLCLEVFEHVKDIIAAVENIKRMTSPGGEVWITTRSHGFPEHHPPDYHRFSKDDLAWLFRDWEIEILEDDPQYPGVFMKAIKPFNYNTPRYFYFPEIPLNACKPNNADKFLAQPGWLKKRMQIHNNPNSLDDYHLPSVREEGQLDPLIITWKNNKWIIEPGQSRWYILHYLERPTYHAIVRVDSPEALQGFVDTFAQFKNEELYSMEDARKTFGLLHSHHHKGIGYLRRKGWFKNE